MSKEATNQQLSDILARERKRLGLDKSLTDEQVVYAKAEDITKEVVREARVILANATDSAVQFNPDHLKTHMQKQFIHQFVQRFTREEMAFLLSVMHAEEVSSTL